MTEMKPNPLLYNFQIQLPDYHCAQDKVFHWMTESHTKAAETASREPMDAAWKARMEKLIRRFSCSPTHIGQRRSELKDFLHTNWSEMQIFNLDESAEGKGLNVRNQFF